MKNTNNPMSRSTVQHWDAVYQTTQQYQHLYLYNQQLLDTIIRSLGDDIGKKKVLEVGCGKAKESLELSRRGVEVVGVDYSENAIELLNEVIVRTSSSMIALQCDGQALPFQDNHFDLVFSQGVIEHFEDPLPLLREQFRVLKPGGILIVEVPNKYNVYTIYKHVLMTLDKWPPGWETQYSPAELSVVVKTAGFVPDKLIGWDTFTLRALRKIGKQFGRYEKQERSWQKTLRRNLEDSTLVTWLSLSLTIIAHKPRA